MGNLHAGHESLLRRAKQENAISVLSIFINPTQFDDKDDFTKYPKTFADDLMIAKDIGVDYVIHPDINALYPNGYRYSIAEKQLSLLMEGKHRQEHFNGVLTVVLKLLMLVKPAKAYFGEKDFQQLQLILGMVKSFFIDTEIIACSIVRDQSGLALSSRNSRLTPAQYTTAIQFPKLLASLKPCQEIISTLKELGFVVDYIEEFEGRRYGAVRLGNVRLIDNVNIK
jgi:pantoate--beta-alanine ligase